LSWWSCRRVRSCRSGRSTNCSSRAGSTDTVSHGRWG
jgi:hypothetical protein